MSHLELGPRLLRYVDSLFQAVDETRVPHSFAESRPSPVRREKPATPGGYSDDLHRLLGGAPRVRGIVHAVGDALGASVHGLFNVPLHGLDLVSGGVATVVGPHDRRRGWCYAPPAGQVQPDPVGVQPVQPLAKVLQFISSPATSLAALRAFSRSPTTSRSYLRFSTMSHQSNSHHVTA